MKQAKSIISILLLVCALPSAHSTCGNVDLRGKVLGESRLQKPLGWCFAYAASDLYSIAIGKRVSAFDLALNYYQGQIDHGLKTGPAELTKWRTGRISPLVERAQVQGVCPDSVFSASTRGSALELRKLDEFLSSLRSLSDLQRRSQVRAFLKRKASVLRELFPTTSLADLSQILVMSAESEYPLSLLSERVCEGERINVAGLKLEPKFAQGRSEVLDFIDQQLSSGRPVAMGYNSDSLKNSSNTYGVDHLSTLIGSKRTTTGCKYLLRNPWGKFDPTRFSPELITNRDGDYVWLPAEYVQSAAVQLYSIKRAP